MAAHDLVVRNGTVVDGRGGKSSLGELTPSLRAEADELVGIAQALGADNVADLSSIDISKLPSHEAA